MRDAEFLEFLQHRAAKMINGQPSNNTGQPKNPMRSLDYLVALYFLAVDAPSPLLIKLEAHSNDAQAATNLATDLRNITQKCLEYYK